MLTCMLIRTCVLLKRERPECLCYTLETIKTGVKKQTTKKTKPKNKCALSGVSNCHLGRFPCCTLLT